MWLPAWDAWVSGARAVDIVDYARRRPDLKLKSSRGGRDLVGPCPQCGGDDRFAVTSTARKKVFRCRGCGAKGDVIALVEFLDGIDFTHAVEKLTGQPPPPKPERKSTKGKIVAEYPYRDEAGGLLFQVVRFEPKDFRQRRPNGRGGWTWNLDGVRLVPYRLAEIIAAIKTGQTVLVVEGEKDVATAETLGFVATCAPGGVGMGWRSQYDEHFTGSDVIIVPDNDEDENKGPRYARTIADHLVKVAGRVRWLTLPHVKDLTEWLPAGGTREQLDHLIASAPDYESAAKPAIGESAKREATSNGIDDSVELETLARMSPLDYERERKAAGKRLGISRLALLDALVKAKHVELRLDGGDMQGKPITLPEPEPWGETVDGAALLDAIAKALRAHVALSDTARDAVTLWILHCYLFDRFLVTPRLCVTSPVPECGKSTLLGIVGRLVPRALSTDNVTPAAIFRVVEAHRPTLLVDEADSFLTGQRPNEEMRGILNSGHRAGGAVLRVVGESLEPRAFATFSPCAIGLIGSLPATLHSRSVLIELKRRLPGEEIAEFRSERAGHLDVLARQAARWTHDHGERIGAADPKMPDGIVNRAADNWRPLLAIATLPAANGHGELARQRWRRGAALMKPPGSKRFWPTSATRSASGWRWPPPTWSTRWSRSTGARGRRWGRAASRSRRPSSPACCGAGASRSRRVTSGRLRPACAATPLHPAAKGAARRVRTPGQISPFPSGQSSSCAKLWG